MRTGSVLSRSLFNLLLGPVLFVVNSDDAGNKGDDDDDDDDHDIDLDLNVDLFLTASHTSLDVCGSFIVIIIYCDNDDDVDDNDDNNPDNATSSFVSLQ